MPADAQPTHIGPVEYRTATPGDEAGILQLWDQSFTARPGWLRTDWKGVRRRHDHTLVAVDDTGVLAVVLYVPRRLRGADGRPVLVGGVAAVATRSDARRRGHAKRLLEAALEAMRSEGCGWSLLFTGTPEVYASLGWRTYPIQFRTGRPVEGGS